MDGGAGRQRVLAAGLLLIGAAGLVELRPSGAARCDRAQLSALVAEGEERLGCPDEVEAAFDACGKQAGAIAPGTRVRLAGCGLRAEPWSIGEARLLGKQVSPDSFSAADWESVPGIGPRLARRIMDERRRAPFGTWEGLDRVRGIGPAKVAELRSRFDAVRR